VNPAADLSALEASKREFLNKHTDQAPYTKIAPSLDEGGFVPNGEGSTPVERPLTLAEAQAEKVGTYRQLKDKAYGELKSSSIEAQKALARGLKEDVYAQYPELQALGAREGALIDLEGQLERYAARHGNRDAIGIGTPLKMIAGGKVAGMLAGALEFPGVKSRLAIALNRAAQVSRQSNPLPAGIPALPTQRPDEPPPFPAQ